MSLPPCGAARHGMARCLPGLESREESADSSSEAVVLQDEYLLAPRCLAAISALQETLTL